MQDIGQNKNLNAHQLKEMRVRLLCHSSSARCDHISTMDIVAPSTGEAAQKPSDDEQMEYQLGG